MSGNADLEAKIIDAIYRGACDAAELSRALVLIAEYFESPGVLLGELDQAQPHRSFAFGVHTIDASFFTGYARCENLDPAPRAYAALDFHFHDLRHEAITRLFERGLNIAEVSAISGHKELRMLQRYTHLRAIDLVSRLG